MTMDVTSRRLTYTLIISQLKQDGFDVLAMELERKNLNQLKIELKNYVQPSDDLLRLVSYNQICSKIIAHDSSLQSSGFCNFNEIPSDGYDVYTITPPRHHLLQPPSVISNVPDTHCISSESVGPASYKPKTRRPKNSGNDDDDELVEIEPFKNQAVFDAELLSIAADLHKTVAIEEEGNQGNCKQGNCNQGNTVTAEDEGSASSDSLYSDSEDTLTLPVTNSTAQPADISDVTHPDVTMVTHPYGNKRTKDKPINSFINCTVAQNSPSDAPLQRADGKQPDSRQTDSRQTDRRQTADDTPPPPAVIKHREITDRASANTPDTTSPSQNQDVTKYTDQEGSDRQETDRGQTADATQERSSNASCQADSSRNSVHVNTSTNVTRDTAFHTYGNPSEYLNNPGSPNTRKDGRNSSRHNHVMHAPDLLALNQEEKLQVIEVLKEGFKKHATLGKRIKQLIPSTKKYSAEEILFAVFEDEVAGYVEFSAVGNGPELIRLRPEFADSDFAEFVCSSM